jgi:DNA-binding LacI/PurR family transcriptional regulator
MRKMGKLAVKKLVNRIDAPDTEISNTVFSPELVLRGSTGSQKATTQTNS